MKENVHLCIAETKLSYTDEHRSICRDGQWIVTKTLSTLEKSYPFSTFRCVYVLIWVAFCWKSKPDGFLIANSIENDLINSRYDYLLEEWPILFNVIIFIIEKGQRFHTFSFSTYIHCVSFTRWLLNFNPLSSHPTQHSLHSLRSIFFSLLLFSVFFFSLHSF